MSRSTRDGKDPGRGSPAAQEAAIAPSAPDWKALVDAWRHSPQNKEAGLAFLADLPVLNPLQRRLLAELRECGVTHIAFSDLVDDQSQWRTLAQDVHTWLPTPDVQAAEAAFHAMAPATCRKDDYLFRRYRRQGEKVTLPWTCPWLQLALEPRILDVVNHYFTMMSHLYHIDLWVTFADAREGPRVSAQNWHRDLMDLRLVKAFLYFSDVDLDSGALQYVRCSRRDDGTFGNVWTPKEHKGGYPPAEAFDRRIPESEWLTCAYPAGTLVLADTTGYHRGGRARIRNRVFATWAYGSQAAWADRLVVEPDSVPGDLAEAARFALFRRPLT